MPQEPSVLEACAFGPRLGNRSVFILDPRPAYLPLNVDRPFNTGLTNLTVIQEHKDDERPKYLSHDKNTGDQKEKKRVTKHYTHCVCHTVVRLVKRFRFQRINYYSLKSR